MKCVIILTLTMTSLCFGEGRVISHDYQSTSGIAKLVEYLEESAIITAAKNADSFLLYEGLPHPMFEHALLRREASREDVVWFHDIPFYDHPIQLEGGDRDKAERFLASPIPDAGYGEGPVAKMCGGFHADWCIVLKKGTELTAAMICFTCSDMIVFTSEAYRYEYMDKKEGMEQLGEG